MLSLIASLTDKTFLLIPDETGFKEEIIKTIGIVGITEIA